MNIAERERLSKLYGTVEAMDAVIKDQGKRLEELSEQVKKLSEKRPVGRPPKNG